MPEGRDRQDASRLARLRGQGSELMNDVKRLCSDLLRDESGQDLIEYALVAALIGLGATAAMKGLATSIGTAFGSVGTKLSSSV
jgi:pilus assembly protein Flp/PilA